MNDRHSALYTGRETTIRSLTPANGTGGDIGHLLALLDETRDRLAATERAFSDRGDRLAARTAERDQARNLAVHFENEATRLADQVGDLKRELAAARGTSRQPINPRSFDSPAQRTAARMYNTETENEATS